jgi:anti-sigma factor ChrR (cupin superfamily)
LKSALHDQEHLDALFLYALHALSSSEMPAVQSQISRCANCQQELEALRPIIGALVAWPTDVLRPSANLWGRLAQQIAAETGVGANVLPSPPASRPEWEGIAPGIAIKLLATDTEKERVSMLVRLDPGADYPPHRHAGVEELHLLHGELMIGDQKFYSGDYYRAEAGSVDYRVWSETGCTCVLLTSTKDRIL